MVPLILPRLAVGAQKIGDGRTAHQDGFLQNPLKRAMQSCELFLFKCTAQPCGMNFRAPQTLVRIDISNAAQKALIQKKRFDPRAARSRLLDKFLDRDFEGIGAEGSQFFGERLGGQVSKTPKSPRVRITQLAVVIEQKKRVCVFLTRLSRRIGGDLSCHSEMHEQRSRRSVAICNSRVNPVDRRKPQQHKFSVALDGLDLPTGKMLFEGNGIVNEIRFAQPHRHDSSADDGTPQPSRYCFDFGKFRHKGIANKIAHPLAAMQAAEPNLQEVRARPRFTRSPPRNLARYFF